MYCALSIQTSWYQPSTLLGSTSCRHYLFTLFLLSTTQRHFCSTLPTGAALCSSLLPLRTSHGCICVLPTHRRPPLCISLTLFRFVFPPSLQRRAATGAWQERCAARPLCCVRRGCTGAEYARGGRHSARAAHGLVSARWTSSRFILVQVRVLSRAPPAPPRGTTPLLCTSTL